MLGRDYYHKIASNFDPQGMAVPKPSCNSTIFITAKCKQISSNQQPTRTFQLCIVRREDVERERKQGALAHQGLLPALHSNRCSPPNCRHSCGSPWTPPLWQVRSGTPPSGSSGPARRSCSRRCTPTAASRGQSSTPTPLPPPLAPPNQQRASGMVVEPPPRWRVAQGLMRR